MIMYPQVRWQTLATYLAMSHHWLGQDGMSVGDATVRMCLEIRHQDIPCARRDPCHTIEG